MPLYAVRYTLEMPIYAASKREAETIGRKVIFNETLDSGEVKARELAHKDLFPRGFATAVPWNLAEENSELTCQDLVD